MDLLGLAGRVLRFKVDAPSWAERGIAEQNALAELRQHPGFHALEDAFDAEVAMLFFEFLNTEPGKEAVLLDIHARARAIRRMTQLLDGTTKARDRARQAEETIKEAERLMEAHRAHAGRRRAAASAATAMQTENVGA